jgi:hypothetical protein
MKRNVQEEWERQHPATSAGAGWLSGMFGSVAAVRTVSAWLVSPAGSGVASGAFLPSSPLALGFRDLQARRRVVISSLAVFMMRSQSGTPANSCLARFAETQPTPDVPRAKEGAGAEGVPGGAEVLARQRRGVQEVSGSCAARRQRISPFLRLDAVRVRIRGIEPRRRRRRR